MASGMTVLIAGAGPVGLTLATLLGRHGIPVIVFEAEPALNPSSQASTFHASTLELLDEIEVAWALIDTGKLTERLQYRDRSDGLVAEFNFRLLRDVTKFPVRLQTDQSELTALLRQEIEQHYPSVTLRFGTRAVTALPTPTGATLITSANGTTQEWEGRFVVGTDGAHSAVRHSAGIAFDGSPYDTRHLMITTSYDVLANMPWLAPVTYIFDEDESVGVLTLRNCTRVVFLISGPETDAEILAPESLQRRLRGFLPPQPEPYPITDARIARLHQRVASQYVKGAIALAGDAAHLNHPLGGMGLNAGIHDAYALGHAIRRVLREGADPAVVDEYGSERRQQAITHVLPAADEYSRTSSQTSAQAREQRNQDMRATAADPVRARQYLYQASMFDSAPARWEKAASADEHV
jgi:2-polyprenyl-6-methoxyphenol hydroxylase-like FAD-dependent oxidoreductase